MSHEAHGHAIDLEAAFNDQEWQDFRREDKRAGGAVIMLMLAIFSVGVVLYTIVNLSIVL